MQSVAPSTAPGADSPALGALARGKAASPADLLITAAFAIVFILQITRHDMWRDEIHSWGLVLASPSLPDLFANLRFTGHPGLWYVILWFASFFTDSPYTVQVVHAAIALLLIAAIGLLSPFSRLERLLLLCSYFVLYEYTVISRNYGLGFLIALLYAEMRATRPDRVYLNAILLGLMANTNLFAFVLSGAFALEYAIEIVFRQERSARQDFKALLPPATLYVAFVAFAVATMWPSPDISWRTTGAPLKNAFDPIRLWALVAANIEPLLPAHALNYWNAKVNGTVHPATILALPAFAAAYYNILRGYRRLLLIPALTFAGSIAVGQLIYANSIRHWGVNFVAFVAVLWIRRTWSPARSPLVVALLAINAAAGIAISVQQFPATFSEGRHTAEWIRDNYPDAALVGTPDTLTMVVAQYLGKPIYQLDCSCTDTYLFYNKRRDAFDKSQIPDRLARAVRELVGRQILFLITHSLTVAELATMRERGVSATKLAAFDHSIYDENFYVYSVKAIPPDATPAAPQG